MEREPVELNFLGWYFGNWHTLRSNKIPKNLKRKMQRAIERTILHVSLRDRNKNGNIRKITRHRYPKNSYIKVTMSRTHNETE